MLGFSSTPPDNPVLFAGQNRTTAAAAVLTARSTGLTIYRAERCSEREGLRADCFTNFKRTNVYCAPGCCDSHYRECVRGDGLQGRYGIGLYSSARLTSLARDGLA